MLSICLACRRATSVRHSITGQGKTAVPLRQQYASKSRHVRLLTTNNRYFRVSEEVQQALSEKRPVVALETTIYTHGFPYPDNLALASHLENVVRSRGGVPATIGILDGIARVGLPSDELSRLASSTNALKISRRDFGFALGLKDFNGKPFNGGTTIAGTMVLAHLAGIKVFATGGLGGVHRGVEQTMDVSADLTELGRTPVAVISSGCKSFLDIPRTLEYLETQGVAVATFADGREGPVHFPAFFSRDSAVLSPKTVHSAKEAAAVIHAHASLGLQSGLHFANPIPLEHEIPFAQMEVAIEQAIAEANAADASGAASTPFILDKIKELTGKQSMVANKALVEKNVIMGTEVAKALEKLEDEEADGSNTGLRLIEPSQQLVRPNVRSAAAVQRPVDRTSQIKMPIQDDESHPDVNVRDANVYVAGILAVDFSCDHSPPSGTGANRLEMHTSNPARIVQSLGGVGHNVARAAHLAGAEVRFCSAVGDDLSGRTAVEALTLEGLTSAAVMTAPGSSGRRTAQYIAVNQQNKDLAIAVADMSILDPPSAGEQVDSIAEAFDDLWLPQLDFQARKPTHLVLDANWPPQYLSRWLTAARDRKIHATYEPVSNAKSRRLFQPQSSADPFPTHPTPLINLATPNAHELAAMTSHARNAGLFDQESWWNVIDSLGIPSTGARVAMALATSPELVDQGIPQQSIQLLPFIPSICTKLGAQGVLVTQLLPANDPRLTSGEYAPYILSRCNNGTEDTLGVGGVYMRLFPPAEKVPADEVVSVNGVGDTFAGVLVAALAKDKARGGNGWVEEWIGVAQEAAVTTLRSAEAVSPDIKPLG